MFLVLTVDPCRGHKVRNEATFRGFMIPFLIPHSKWLCFAFILGHGKDVAVVRAAAPVAPGDGRAWAR